MLELESGKVSHTFNCSAVAADMEDIKDDPVTALAVSDDEFGSYLFTTYRSGLIVKWSRDGIINFLVHTHILFSSNELFLIIQCYRFL